jgi:hypothetical protein
VVCAVHRAESAPSKGLKEVVFAEGGGHVMLREVMLRRARKRPLSAEI